MHWVLLAQYRQRQHQRISKHINHLCLCCLLFLQTSLFTFSHLKEELSSRLNRNDWDNLRSYFSLPLGQVSTITGSQSYSENTLLLLEERGYIHPSNVDRLSDAFADLSLQHAYLVTQTFKNLGGNQFIKEKLSSQKILLFYVWHKNVEEQMEYCNTSSSRQIVVYSLSFFQNTERQHPLNVVSIFVSYVSSKTCTKTNNMPFQ